MSQQEHKEEGPQNRAGTVVRCIAKTSFPKYTPSRLATPPSTLHPAEYDISLETYQAQAERLAVRDQLKREYLLQYNDPNCRRLIEDSALIGWTYARSANVYPNFTPKNSLLGVLCGIRHLFFWYYVFKTDRNRKEKLI
ncbi:NADH dehydrogenase [ubiquinone] 1 beta subcomplex subunit 4-like [Symphalangus syndactylus]|uniref:NADH dehydrogenase [ubiquinone] 1 beta subcomplex subunit 4-like n=1 Tax=Symphalangus syndactylus TaxID=9590 RepID=UPI0030069D23